LLGGTPLANCDISASPKLNRTCDDGNRLTLDLCVENMFNGEAGCTNTPVECTLNSDCSPTECDFLDGCYGNVYRNYTEAENLCTNYSCTRANTVNNDIRINVM